MLTYKELRELEFDEDDNFRHELLNGYSIQKEKATILHQMTSGNITFEMQKYLDKNQIGELFFAPLDVVLDDHNAPQPDIIFVGKNKYYILNEEIQVIVGSPDIIIEILSPGSIKKDRIIKKKSTNVPKSLKFGSLTRIIKTSKSTTSRMANTNFLILWKRRALLSLPF
ncbi:MAG TPA: Uma2 family endonuclease [Bacteroidetes bacterium]|nr:Uma2 family endonuclease [Bacteroidota bacterium]